MKPTKKRKAVRRGQKWKVRGYTVISTESDGLVLAGETVVAETKDTGEWMIIEHPVFKRKKDAEQFRDGVDTWEVVPCTITYDH